MHDKRDGLLRGVESLLRRSLQHGLLKGESEAMLLDIDAVLGQPSERDMRLVWDMLALDGNCSVPELTGPEKLRRLLDDLIAARSALGWKVTGWTAAKDAMPPHGENVLFVTQEGCQWFGWRDTRETLPCEWRDHFDDGKVCTDEAVVLWRPFPLAPVVPA